jgi:hypothetical protein
MANGSRADLDAISLHPEGTLMGIIDHPDEAAAAVRDLVEAGFDEKEVHVLAGEEGAERVDASGQEHGLSGVMTRVTQSIFGEEHDHAERHERELRVGHLLIAVPADRRERWERAHAVLKEHGGHFIHLYGRWSIRTLEP